MTDQFIGFVLFWGVWLFVPMLIDGVTAVSYFIGAFKSRATHRARREAAELDYYPLISVIIPVHNGATVLQQCLASLRAQTYPHRRIEVLVIDNMSTDATVEVFNEEQQKPFGGAIHWISLPFKGKAGALNAGIHRTSGELILNMDADVVLERDAFMEIAREFDADPDLAAATGAIAIMPVKGRDMHPLRYMMAEAEFLEYYTGFQIGRQYQSETGSLFTLAGAFSAFRRDVLLRTFLYDTRTVSEDTSLTFFIAARFPELNVRCVSSAIAYVEPVPDLKSLYAQRVRWQRGELEVASLFPQFVRHPFRLRGISASKALLVDHTLAFPRLVWTFLLPLMFLVGYPLELVVSATLSMYLIYMVVDALYMTVAYMLADDVVRRRLRSSWWLFMFMPAFRWMTFWFRFGGFLSVMMDTQSWRVLDPVTETKFAVQRVGTATLTFMTQTFIPRIAAVLSGIARTR